MVIGRSCKGESVSKQLFQGVLFKREADWVHEKETRRKDFLKWGQRSCKLTEGKIKDAREGRKTELYSWEQEGMEAGWPYLWALQFVIMTQKVSGTVTDVRAHRHSSNDSTCCKNRKQGRHTGEEVSRGLRGKRHVIKKDELRGQGPLGMKSGGQGCWEFGVWGWGILKSFDRVVISVTEELLELGWLNQTENKVTGGEEIKELRDENTGGILYINVTQSTRPQHTPWRCARLYKPTYCFFHQKISVPKKSVGTKHWTEVT